MPYGIDLANYAPASSAKQGGEVLYAGRLCYYKGVEVLLDAAPAIRGRITILGNGPWCKRLMQQAQRLRLGERVSFLGQVPEQTLIERMQASRVFVFPSTERSEAFGLAQLKAMACGLPVVSSDLPGVSWLNRCGETGLTVPVRDASALAQAVNRLLADADLREQLSLGARARAKQFTLSTMAQTIGGIYASVA